MIPRISYTAVVVPREWLPKLPGEWDIKVVDDDSGDWTISEIELQDICDLPEMIVVHVPAGEGLPMELAPKDEYVLAVTEGGFWETAIRGNENTFESLRTSGYGHVVEIIPTAWLPLPEAKNG